MKTITSFDDALQYVNRLGFGIPQKHAYPGWIPEAQRRLCNTVERIEKLMYPPLTVPGVYSQPLNVIYPYRVKFNRSKQQFKVWDKYAPVGSPCSYTVDAE